MQSPEGLALCLREGHYKPTRFAHFTKQMTVLTCFKKITGRQKCSSSHKLVIFLLVSSCYCFGAGGIASVNLVLSTGSIM